MIPTKNAGIIRNIIIVFLLFGTLSSCKLIRAFAYNKPDINDYKKFPSKKLQNNSVKFTFHNSEKKELSKVTLQKKIGELTFNDLLENSNTVAFLIIRNDTILYERYFEGYDQASIVPSFSMAKPIVSTLIGCAIDEGLIQSTNEPITNFIPELIENGFSEVTIEHLLQMTSGAEFNEDYSNPFGDVATLYYGTNLKKAILKMKLETKPGKEFSYASGNTQLLGFALEHVLKGKSVTQYLQDKLWQPLGMEFDASWSIDGKRNEAEKTFCCINATARDFAKIGRLYLHNGNWNGKQIVSEQWIANSIKIDTTNGSTWDYQYNWWLPSKTGDFMAHGKGGQYIYINPAKGIIIVRLGIKSEEIDWPELFINLASSY